VLSQELYVHTFLESNDVGQAQKIAESCRSGGDNNTGVINWLQTQKNVLTASESSMVKSQVMVETENRILPILDHMANAVKHAPKALEGGEAILKQHKSSAALRVKRAEACEALYQVDATAVATTSDADHSAGGVLVSSLQQVGMAVSSTAMLWRSTAYSFMYLNDLTSWFFNPPLKLTI